VAALGGAAHNRVELCNTTIQIPHGGLGRRDPLRDRRGVTIDRLLRGDLML
jgi:hypothetical protein